MENFIFHSMSLNPDAFNETPDTTRFIDSTGYEKIGKTIDRLMVAGLNLYQVNRNGDYQAEDADSADIGGVAPSKYYDEKSAIMRMREIQARLRHKVNSQIVVPDTTVPDTVTPPVDVVKET